MAQVQDYAELFLAINAAEITQKTNVSVTINSGNQRVDVMKEGLVGFTSGPGDITVEVGFVVPIGGLEYNAINDAANLAFVDIQVGIGAETIAGRGKLETVTISQSVGAAVEGTLTWIGPRDGFK